MIDIQTFLQEQNQPDYREQQFNRAYYQQYISSFDELTTWSKDLRAQLKASHDFSSLKLQQRQVSAKKDTIKALFSLRRDRRQQVESVLMRHQDGRNTVCVSCMVGCPVACSFCATGQMGLRLNLRAREIIDQILYFARWLQAQQSQDQSSAERLTNIVFMGMGEPMLNLPAVEQAINTIINPEQMGFSQRRITVSTVGYPEQITQFVDDGYDQVRLAISLHAPTQELRTEIMPIAKVFPLEQLFKAIDYYVGQCNKLVSYEYLLLAGVNDQPQQARQLGQLLQKRLAHVNLIPFNPVPGIKYQRPHPQQVKRFAQVLDQAGISNSIRVTMGKDIDAACGQLSSANS